MMCRCVGGGKIISSHMGVCLILFIVALAELCQEKNGRKIGITESREKEVGGGLEMRKIIVEALQMYFNKYRLPDDPRVKQSLWSDQIMVTHN